MEARAQRKLGAHVRPLVADHGVPVPRDRVLCETEGQGQEVSSKAGRLTGHQNTHEPCPKVKLLKGRSRATDCFALETVLASHMLTEPPPRGPFLRAAPLNPAAPLNRTYHHLE